MIQTSHIQPLRQHVQTWQQQGKTIALVPTMGNLHHGHLVLIKEAIRLADISIVSIFVNPIQFDKQVDLDAYPNTLNEDIALLEELHCDLLFTPDKALMYPKTAATRIEVSGVSEKLEGSSRLGHFSGVATIVGKLFNLTRPDIAIFGEKDYQQLMVVRQMADDLNFDVEVVGHPIVREADGLAMSSRNSYLTQEERNIAPVLQKTLIHLTRQIQEAPASASRLIQEAKDHLSQHGFIPDYIDIRRQKDMKEPHKNDHELIVLASAWLGKARLLDNLSFTLKNEH